MDLGEHDEPQEWSHDAGEEEQPTDDLQSQAEELLHVVRRWGLTVELSCGLATTVRYTKDILTT